MRQELLKKRKELGLTQQEMARKIGVTQQCYNHIEKGVRNPRLDIAKKIADILGISDIHLF